MTFYKNCYFVLALFLIPLLLIQVDSAFAAEPVLEFKDFKRITGTTFPSTTWINFTSTDTTGYTDSLLVVGVAIDNKNYPGSPTQVLSMTFGPDGATCPGTQSFSYVPNSNSTNPDETSTQFWYLTGPQEGICKISIKLSQPHGAIGVPVYSPATAVSMLFSGVDQSNPFQTSMVYTATGTGSSTSVTPSGVTSDQLVLDIFSASVGGATQAFADFTTQQPSIYKSTSGTNPFISFKMGLSKQSGTLYGDDPMTWTLSGSGEWAASAMVIASCDISSSCFSSGSTGDSDSGCSGDCTPPTLGVDFYHNRLVSNGFGFNGNFVDVELYYTPYPLITAYVGEENSIALIVYEDSGPQNLEHVGVAFGLGQGESFNESKAIIHWEKDFNGIETVSLIDPENTLENVRVDVEEKLCQEIAGTCTHLTFYHTFMAPLEFNMVATNIWDFDRNAWQNYYNHGIEVTGDSLNPKQVTGIFKGKIFQLNQTDTNKSIDENGEMWTFDKGLWNKDYVPIKKTDPELTNEIKLWAIKHVQKDSFNDALTSVILDRNLNYFVLEKEYQQLLAESILEEMCPKCLDESFEEIDDIFNYDFPVESERLLSLNGTMYFEMQRANNTVSQMFSSFYPGIVSD